MSRSALLSLMTLIEGGFGLFLLMLPELARRLLLGDALPGLTGTGLRLAGLCLLGLGLMCLNGLLRRRLQRPFTVMVAYNSVAAIALAGVGLFAGPAGPLLWPAFVLHGTLVGLQLRAGRAD